MDSLDVRILRAYFQDQQRSPLTADFRSSLAAMARQVGVDEVTVRYRLKSIIDSGFIGDWRLTINPHLWGGGQACVWFDVDSVVPKRPLIDALRLVPGVIFVHAFYDKLVAFYDYEDERTVPRAIPLMRSVLGVPESFVARVAFPECRAVLTARDWDLIRALRKSPRKAYGELAREVGLSARTARVRLSRILDQDAVFAWPSLDFRAIRGGVLIHLIAWYPGERKTEVDGAIASHLEPYLWHIMHMLPYRADDLWPCSYNLLLPSLSDARKVLDWARSVPGVEEARFEVHEGVYNFFDAYDRLLDQRLARMPTKLPAVRLETSRRKRAPLQRT